MKDRLKLHNAVLPPGDSNLAFRSYQSSEATNGTLLLSKSLICSNTMPNSALQNRGTAALWRRRRLMMLLFRPAICAGVVGDLKTINRCHGTLIAFTSLRAENRFPR